MSTIDETADALTNKQLTDCVKTRLRGGAMKADTPTQLSRAGHVLWTWIRERKGWISVVLLTATWAVPFMLVNIMLAGTSVSLALSIGRTTRSRIIILLCASVLLSVIIFFIFFGLGFKYAVTVPMY